MTTVAYQGEPGAFSEDAARRLVAGSTPRGYTTFDEIIEAVERGEAEFALLPVENSIYGPIARAYDLLWEHQQLRVTDEIVYRVVQSLIGTPAAQIDGLTEVRSHPVALEQCRRLFTEHPAWRRVAVDDTAGAVRAIVALDDPRVAAIAHASAAERYGGRLLREGVQDDADNFTRFLLIARGGSFPADYARACVVVDLDDRPGSLRDALSALADHGINLRSLVARPSRGTVFRYRFYCEVDAADPVRLPEALAAIGGDVRLLGAY